MMNKFRFILHIGTEKTGTSTLQHLLHQHQQALQKQGVYYYASANRVEARTLAAAAIGDHAPDDHLKNAGINTPEQRQIFRTQVAEHFNKSMESLPASVHTVIISSEHFHSRLNKPEQLQWLQALLSPWCKELQVIVYLRRQVDLAASYYSTELKNGGIRTLEQAARQGCKPSNHYFNYQSLLSLWGNVFKGANITPRVFDQRALQQKDIITDFFHTTKLEENHSIIKRVSKRRYNESLTPFGQKLLLALNIAIKNKTTRASLNELAELRILLNQQFSGPGEYLSYPIALELQSAFSASNAQVCEKWFPEKDELFSRVPQPAGKHDNDFSIKEEQIKLAHKVFDYLGMADTTGFPELDIYADKLRDAAITIEQKNLPLAIQLMELAWRIRPHGSLINRKLGEYSAHRSCLTERLKQWVKKIKILRKI